MRCTNSTIAVISAIVLSCHCLSPALAQDDTMVITPESYADMVRGA